MSPVVISAVAALGGVLLGQVLARSGEYSKWRRAERHRAAAELLAAGEALRRHSAAVVLARVSGELPAGASDTHLGDMERLELAVDAVRTLFPQRVSALAVQLREAATAVGLVGLGPATATTEKLDADSPRADEASPGETYMAARMRFTDAARGIIAPAFRDRIKSLAAPVARGHQRRSR